MQNIFFYALYVIGSTTLLIKKPSIVLAEAIMFLICFTKDSLLLLVMSFFHHAFWVTLILIYNQKLEF